ncbi:MBL fold metallo-hydrolase [Alkalimarinus coralli]|uniref:MBL fold metallo-hydrolase n=1 Tax=Alkalimarinus coralli TaxID=2935863 RepID=UPI00202B879C|nr:MBL fold metallo-hydrolase [Alkalimarinus coralli]
MAHRIHHLNCATLCPQGARLINGKGGLFAKSILSCHCLLIESNEGLILIDTGFSVEDMQSTGRMGLLIAKAMNPVMDVEQTALYQIEKLGFSRNDVKHIVLTHLDPDHAGGIVDFPHAKIHVHEKEYSAGTEPCTLVEKYRYRSQMWQHNPDWQLHRVTGERWFGFDSVHVLNNRLQDLLLVPLHGHSRGHCGVAVATTEGWVLHCGDAYFHQSEMDLDKPRCTPGLSLTQMIDESSRADRLHNQQQLRSLKRDNPDITLFCSHDHGEFETCSACPPIYLKHV